MRLVPLVALAIVLAPSALSAVDGLAAPVVVGTRGNEPLVRIAPDGTIYVSALHYLYRSTDLGATWSMVSPPLAAQLTLASDSTIAFAPDGATYMAFDWPYAGSTAVCLTRDRGASWLCNPEAVPGVNDRMWIRALPDGRTILVSAVALFQTASFVSVAPGVPVYAPVPQDVVSNEVIVAQGQLGDFAVGWGAKRWDGVIRAPISTSPWGFVLWSSTGGYVGRVPYTSFYASGFAIPAFARDGAGRTYATDDDGTGIRLVRDDSASGVPTWRAFDVVTSGRTRFASVAAGPPGHVAIVFYWAPAGDETYYAYKAVSTNANGAAPTFTISQLSTGIAHVGNIQAGLGSSSRARFAGDFISAAYGPDGVPAFAWQEDHGRPAPTVLFHR